MKLQTVYVKYLPNYRDLLGVFSTLENAEKAKAKFENGISSAEFEEVVIEEEEVDNADSVYFYDSSFKLDLRGKSEVARQNKIAESIFIRIDLYREVYHEDPKCLPLTELEFKALEMEVERSINMKEIRDRERKIWELKGIAQAHYFDNILIKIV